MMRAESQTLLESRQDPSLVPSPGHEQRPSSAGPRVPVVMVPVSWYTTVKRLFDIVVAMTLLVLAIPVLVFIGLAVKLTSRGPIFYSQTRVGRGGKPFTIFKIRSMYHECEKVSGAVWCAGKKDPRVMPIGRFLRRSHLDELPQLWNVLRGDMSMVGPRPERPEFIPQLEQAIPHYRERLLVMPGVTGLAQIHLDADTDLSSVERKLAFDLYYIKTLSCWNDMKVIVGTAFHVLRPFLLSHRLFGLTPQRCADLIGMRLRLEKSGLREAVKV